MASPMKDKSASAHRLGVVIVNYKTPALTARCIDSLAPMLPSAGGVAVVVDNDSQDGSFEQLRDFCAARPESDRLTVVQAGRNGGFAAGNNVGVERLKAEYVLLLNSDAIVHDGALQAMLSAADAAPNAGLTTPAIVTSSGVEEVSRFRNHSPLSEFIDGAQTGPLTKLFPHAEAPIYPNDWDAPPDWVSFAAVLIRREAIEKVGPMDDGFFLYYEDCDYCRRIKTAGYTIAKAPDAVFTHDAGGTTKLREQELAQTRLPAYYYASRARYFQKYYGPLGPVFANVAWMTGRLIAKLRGLFGRPAPQLCQARARDIWIGWRS